jgi:Holliday junction DNA helicase RuvA
MARGDAIRLQSIPGVGKKTAERIALELSEKAHALVGDDSLPHTQIVSGEDKRIFDDALSALLNLGYSAKSAKNAVEKARFAIKDISLEGLIKEALRLLT